MPTSEEVVATAKTKIDLGTRKFVIRPVSKSCDLRKNGSYVNKGNHGGSEQSSTAIGTKQKLATRKRGPSGTLEPDNQKRRKMGLLQCSHFLEKLMTHPAGWVFNQPVDPLMLNIPDYFSVVTHPMDLGTIKSKLVNNSYFGPGEFVADVRLTFSNAMLYNPDNNSVHLMAKELDDVFSKLWKSFDANRSCESSKADHEQILNGRATKAIIATKKKAASLPKRSMSFEDTQNLRKELCSVLRRNNTPRLRITLRRFGLPLKIDENFERTFDTLKDERLFELRKLMRNFVDTSATEVKSAKTITNRNGESLKNFRNSDIRHACPSDSRRALGATSIKCGLCGNVKCRCSVGNDSIREFSSDLSSERSINKDYSSTHADNFKEIERKELHQCHGPASSSHDSMSDSNRAVSVVDDEIICRSSHLGTSVIAEISGEVVDIQLSPKIALRAALLKRRFADTIMKAQHKTLIGHGDQVDGAKIQKEKEIPEKKQHEEKTRIEAKIRVAAQVRTDFKLKTQRQKEREAARVAVQMVERTVEIDENLQIMKELEMLSGFSPSDHESIATSGSESPCTTFFSPCTTFFSPCTTFFSPCIGNSLERFGLILKSEYLGDEEDEDMALNQEEAEEGEIIS